MKLRLPALLTPLVLASLLALPACGHGRRHASDTPEIAIPETIGDLDNYALARNAYALLPLDHARREGLRADLREFLIGYVDQAIAKDERESAIEGLEQLVDLWTAREQATLKPDPEIAALARRLYESVAPAGDERAALLALAIEQAYGSGESRAAAEQAYAQLRDWIERGGEFSPDPSFADEQEQLLEDVSGVFPSPWVIDQLGDLYLARLRRAQRGEGSAGLGMRDPRVPFTGYLLARAYLRADRLDDAVAALDRLQLDEPTQSLRDMIANAALESRGEGGDPRSTADLDQLTVEFVPTPDSKLPEPILRQSWGIVENLAKRSLARSSEHPPAQLALGRVLRAKGLLRAAIVHYEDALASKTRATHHDDMHRAYLELAGLYQAVLVHTANDDLAAAEAMLDDVEDFHRRARQAWPQRPIEPTLGDAWLTVALAMYEGGSIDEAQKLLDRTIEIEPQPGAFVLLATIQLRRGEFERARGWLAKLDKLSFEDQLARYDWQIRSAMLHGEIDRLDRKRDAANEHLGEARRQLDTLLSYPGLDDELRVEFLTRRARVLLELGEVEAAMADFRDARVIAPGRLDVYSGPLTFTVSHGYYEAALEIYESAITSDAVDDDLLVYFSLWLIDLAERHGKPAPERATSKLRALAEKGEARSPWSLKLAQHGLGELDYDALIGAASTARERSEAYFYEGLRRWRSGKREAGLELMRKVVAADMMGDFEYEMAQSYLIWQELPKTARAD
ncbi:tetratricopeptide repeat protein [Nannocystaceae bacterium ST9]